MISRKKLFITSILLCLFLLIACDTIEEEQLATGSWDGDVFTNWHTDLQFQLPNSWRDFTAEESLELAAFVDRSPLSTARQEIAQLGITGEFTNDMVVVNLSATEESVQVITGRLEPGARNRSLMDAFELMFDRLPSGASYFTAIEILEIVQGNMLLAEIRDATIYDAPVIIGSYEFFVMQTTVETTFGIRVPRRLYLNVAGEYIRLIITTAQNSERIAEIMSFFDIAGAPRREVGEKVIFNRDFEILEANTLIGSWAWDLNHDFSYVFESDGTGSRGFSTMQQAFEWTFFEGVLALDIHLTDYSNMIELWQTSLVDNVLTLTSLYAPDTDEFDYIREASSAN